MIQRHEDGTAIHDSDVGEEEQGRWRVRSQNGQSRGMRYTVRRTDRAFCLCLNQCSRCVPALCAQMYTCTCPDGRRHGLCKHVHKAHLYHSNGQRRKS